MLTLTVRPSVRCVPNTHKPMTSQPSRAPNCNCNCKCSVSKCLYYDVTWFEYALWCRTMHEWVMNIHYQTWIAQGRFINIILMGGSKQWGVCDNYTKVLINFLKKRKQKHCTYLQKLCEVDTFSFSFLHTLIHLIFPNLFQNFLKYPCIKI